MPALFLWFFCLLFSFVYCTSAFLFVTEVRQGKHGKTGKEKQHNQQSFHKKNLEIKVTTIFHTRQKLLMDGGLDIGCWILDAGYWMLDG
jgi:hypothetical protein